MQILMPPHRQFRGLGARPGSSGGAAVSRDSARGAGGRTGYRSGMRERVQNASSGSRLPAKPTIDQLITDPASAYDAALESDIAPLVDKFKRGIAVNEGRSDAKLYKLKFDDRGFYTGAEDVTPTGVNPEEIAYLNAVTKAGKWAMKTLSDEINSLKDKTDNRSRGRSALAWEAYNAWYSVFVPLAQGKFAAFRNKRKNWESNIAAYSAEALGIPDTVDSVGKLTTLAQKVQNAVESLDVGGVLARPLIQNLAARATQLGAKITASEADDALVVAAETMALDELANAVTTATAVGKPGLAARLKAVYDRRKKAADDADKLIKAQEEKDAKAAKDLQDVKDAAAAEAEKSKNMMIFGGIAALAAIAYFATRK